MKLIILIITLSLTTKAFSQAKPDELQQSSNPTYGYTASNPLKAKKVSPMKSIAYAEEFLSGLRTSDDQKLSFLRSYSVKDPSYEKPKIQLTNRYSGMPLNGKVGLLDNYIFVTSVTKDTIQIYVDIYNKGILMVPVNLKYTR